MFIGPPVLLYLYRILNYLHHIRTSVANKRIEGYKNQNHINDGYPFIKLIKTPSHPYRNKTAHDHKLMSTVTKH